MSKSDNLICITVRIGQKLNKKRSLDQLLFLLDRALKSLRFCKLCLLKNLFIAYSSEKPHSSAISLKVRDVDATSSSILLSFSECITACKDLPSVSLNIRLSWRSLMLNFLAISDTVTPIPFASFMYADILDVSLFFWDAELDEYLFLLCILIFWSTSSKKHSTSFFILSFVTGSFSYSVSNQQRK